MKEKAKTILTMRAILKEIKDANPAGAKLLATVIDCLEDAKSMEEHSRIATIGAAVCNYLMETL